MSFTLRTTEESKTPLLSLHHLMYTITGKERKIYKVDKSNHENVTDIKNDTVIHHNLYKWKFELVGRNQVTFF